MAVISLLQIFDSLKLVFFQQICWHQICWQRF
jgi:hypothetical protein